MGFNIGDKVRIIPNLSADKEYNGLKVTKQMVRDFACTIATIKSATPEGRYKIIEDGGDWNWTDDMLLKLDEDTVEPTHSIYKINGYGSVITLSDGTRIYHPNGGNPIQLLPTNTFNGKIAI